MKARWRLSDDKSAMVDACVMVIAVSCVKLLSAQRAQSYSALSDNLQDIRWSSVRRAEMAYERGGDFLEDARKILNREVRGPRLSGSFNVAVLSVPNVKRLVPRHRRGS
jgi:hypothetical protein